MNQVWKSIPSLNYRFEASNTGEIRRRTTLEPVARASKGRVAVPRLGRKGGVVYLSVARLVLEAFNGPAGEAVAVAINGNISDCALTNLAWRPRGERIARGRHLAAMKRINETGVGGPKYLPLGDGARLTFKRGRGFAVKGL